MEAPEQAIPIGCLGETMEDRSLIARARSGDDGAFEELMRIYQRSVLGLCGRMLGPSGDAEDAAQEVFFRLYRSLGRFQDERRIEPWLFRIAYNLCRDRLRSRRVAVELEETVAAVPARGESALVLQEVRQALERLTDKERAALLLREVEGLETEEVAERMGNSAVTVRTHISRARAKLRQWLGGGR